MKYFAIPLAMLAISTAFADDPKHTITVTAKIQSPEFYVVNPDNLTNSTLELLWDPDTQKLGEAKQVLKMKNTAKGIQAKLEAPAQLKDGVNVIPLVVKVGGVVVTNTAQEILTASAAANESAVDVLISPQGTQTPPFKEGQYLGTVKLMFEPKL